MEALLEATSILAGIPLADVNALACTLTGSDRISPVRRGHSGLNHDGVPFQVCASISRHGVNYRLLGDPASDVPERERRFRRSLQATDSILMSGRSSALEPVIAATLAELVGSEGIFHPAHYPDGVVWLARRLGGPGVAVYVDARDGGRDPEARLRAWLARIVCWGDDAEHLVRTVMGGRIMSAGVEGVAPGHARAKVYWRLSHPVALRDLGIGLFHAPAFAQAVEMIVGDRVLPLDGIVLNASLGLPDGIMTDAKLDICCCPRCVSLTAADGGALIAKLADRFDLPRPALSFLLQAGELAFIGIGVDRDGEIRLNIYLKPRNAG